ncbi:Arm DNA-binding domain-containing protein [Croceicoccus sp. F390]|uniref:Arm DNA-binding domain-containing protein n=1 Tax=Croceicoccus esteveae TaxID=3075597 RepID=A0ABU2ZIY7_9SPHN|nr:Arm DNA-binding domain-containing protein [Croceicoccus sp. F390]MDT0576560.1 Arm DNA-binding domain-containing protein [Croceicoccus sp. F390]
MGKLTALAVRANLLKPGTYQDGDGLFLKVRANRDGGAGSAQGLVRIQCDGKRQTVRLGSAKIVSLAQARAKADELRNAIKVGKRDVLAEKKDEAAARVTFRVAARQYHTENAAILAVAGAKRGLQGRLWPKLRRPYEQDPNAHLGPRWSRRRAQNTVRDALLASA